MECTSGTESQDVSTNVSKTRQYVQAVLDYVDAGLLNNIAGTTCLAGAAVAPSETGNNVLMAVFIVAALLNYLLALGKYGDYREVRKELEKNGWRREQDKIAPKLHCSRRALKLAAKRAGFEEEMRVYMKGTHRGR